jgi:hypothetical protein
VTPELVERVCLLHAGQTCGPHVFYFIFLCDKKKEPRTFVRRTVTWEGGAGGKHVFYVSGIL